VSLPARPRAGGRRGTLAVVGCGAPRRCGHRPRC